MSKSNTNHRLGGAKVQLPLNYKNNNMRDRIKELKAAMEGLRLEMNRADRLRFTEAQKDKIRDRITTVSSKLAAMNDSRHSFVEDLLRPYKHKENFCILQEDDGRLVLPRRIAYKGTASPIGQMTRDDIPDKQVAFASIEDIIDRGWLKEEAQKMCFPLEFWQAVEAWHDHNAIQSTDHKQDEYIHYFEEIRLVRAIEAFTGRSLWDIYPKDRKEVRTLRLLYTDEQIEEMSYPESRAKFREMVREYGINSMKPVPGTLPQIKFVAGVDGVKI